MVSNYKHRDISIYMRMPIGQKKIEWQKKESIMILLTWPCFEYKGESIKACLDHINWNQYLESDFYFIIRLLSNSSRFLGAKQGLKVFLRKGHVYVWFYCRRIPFLGIYKTGLQHSGIKQDEQSC
jgi:hypothetical protein